jgi:hypothetical protein
MECDWVGIYMYIVSKGMVMVERARSGITSKQQNGECIRQTNQIEQTAMALHNKALMVVKFHAFCYTLLPFISGN